MVLAVASAFRQVSYIIHHHAWIHFLVTGAAGSGLLATTASVVKISLTAFWRAERLTLTGSMIPASILIHLPVATWNLFRLRHFSNVNAIVLHNRHCGQFGAQALPTRRDDIVVRSLHPLNSKGCDCRDDIDKSCTTSGNDPLLQLREVALRASSILTSFLSILFLLQHQHMITQHHRTSQTCSCNFSRSNSEVVVSICDLITATRLAIASGLPEPSMTVLSLSTDILTVPD